MVASYAFVNIIAEYAITNVTFITFACIDTVVVVTSCEGITVMIYTQTFIDIITNDSVSGETIGTTAIIATWCKIVKCALNFVSCEIATPFQNQIGLQRFLQ